MNLKAAAIGSIASFVIIFAIGATRKPHYPAGSSAPEAAAVEDSARLIEVSVRGFDAKSNLVPVHATVSIGMSGADVEAALGNLHSRTTSHYQDNTLETWRYDSSKSMTGHHSYVFLEFRNDRLYSVTED